MIDRHKLIKRHNVKLEEPVYDSPLSVGNGEFVFTADVTGLQTLYREYESVFPLCTMGNFGWHTENDQGRAYTLDDLPMTEYCREGRTFRYPVKKTPENERIYDWLRQNPHKTNLFRLGFAWDEKDISPNQLSHIVQELDLYEGCLNSVFKLEGMSVRTQTVCSTEANRVACHIELGEENGETGTKDHLSVILQFPYGSPKISGSDWESSEKHESRLISLGKNCFLINRVMDDLMYQVLVHLENAELRQIADHGFGIRFLGKTAEITVQADRAAVRQFPSFAECRENATAFWKEYWKNTGLIDFGTADDRRAQELERREILSLYLLRLQCAGSLPPAETGLSCNSWYGKFHLEMHFWHSAFWPLYSQGKLLENSFSWYRDHLKQAKENAARNGYKGARWPKMVGYDGCDSPSPIAPLLVWQQPHIIFMLELLYQAEEDRNILEKYAELVWETAEFMADFAEWNPEKRVYELNPPLIPVQETHKPMVTKNPAFELEYWRETLGIAVKWARRLNREYPKKWEQVSRNMARPAVLEGVYLAHENAQDTFQNHAKDHPSMLMACGLLRGDDLDRETVKRTLEKVLDVWDFDTAWGWDFAVMAMSAARLGMGDVAIDLLLKPTQKNEYVRNGHNKQGYRKDLPVYLPGNGSFLYALAVMAAGCGKSGGNSGFPKEWNVQTEGIKEVY